MLPELLLIISMYSYSVIQTIALVCELPADKRERVNEQYAPGLTDITVKREQLYILILPLRFYTGT